eukprot:g2843.t1
MSRTSPEPPASTQAMHGSVRFREDVGGGAKEHGEEEEHGTEADDRPGSLRAAAAAVRSAREGTTSDPPESQANWDSVARPVMAAAKMKLKTRSLRQQKLADLRDKQKESCVRSAYKAFRIWSSLKIPGTNAPPPEKTCCLPLVARLDVLRATLAFGATLMMLNLFLGLALDYCFFDVAIFFTWALPMWSIVPVGMMAIRFQVHVKYRSRRLLELVNLIFFAVFFALLHKVALDFHNLAPFPIGLYVPNPGFNFQQNLREMIADEEFNSEDSPNVPKKFADIASEEELWQWLGGPFMNNILSCDNDGGGEPNRAYSLQQGCILGEGHYMRWGGLRLRTHRAKKMPCGSSLFDLIEGGCFWDFSEDQMQQGDEWPKPGFFNVTIPDGSNSAGTYDCSGLEGALKWRNDTFVNYRDYRMYKPHIYGKAGIYPASGFVLDMVDGFDTESRMANFDPRGKDPRLNSNAALPSNYAAVRKQHLMQCLREAGLVDTHTRFLSLEQTILNPATHRYAYVVVLFEFSAAGIIEPTLRIQTGNVPRMTCFFEDFEGAAPFGWPAGPCQTDVCRRVHEKFYSSRFTLLKQQCALTANSTVPQARESYANSDLPRYRTQLAKPYILPDLHFHLMVIMLVWYQFWEELEELVESGFREYLLSKWNLVDLTGIVLAMLAYGHYLAAVFRTPILDLSYTEYQPFNDMIMRCRDYMCLLITLVWLKWLKYLSWFESLRIIARTLKLAAAQLVSFVVLFVFMFCSFTVPAFLIHGAHLKAYSTWLSKTFSLLVGLNGDMDYEGLTMGVGGGLFGAIMAVAFTLTMVFVLLTILIAIIDVNFISATGLGEAAGTEENLVRWLSKIPVPRYGVACTIRIVIFRGRNLAVGDPEFGTSDPYIKVNCTGPKSAGKRPHPDKRKTYQTKTKRGTLNPVWEEAIELDGDIDDDRIVLSLYDEDIISQDEFLGEAIIPLYLLEDDRTVHHVNMRVGDVHRCPESGAPLPAPIVPHHVLEETRERRHKLERTSSSSDNADDDSNSKGAAGKAGGGGR